MITTILFDYYGVFVSDTYTVWLDSHGLTRSGTYQDIVEKMDRGKIGAKEFYGILSSLSGESTNSIEALFRQPHTLNQAVVDILKELSIRYTIALTSNGTTHSRKVLQQNGIDTFFDAFFISSELGVAKPSEAFFQTVTEALSIEPHQAVLIDDAEMNIKSAARYGFHTVHYSGSEDLRKHLQSLKLL